LRKEEEDNEEEEEVRKEAFLTDSGFPHRPPLITARSRHSNTATTVYHIMCVPSRLLD